MSPKPTPVPVRFWSKVDKTDTCWLWVGCCHKTVPAHRLSYSLVHGEIPEGLQIDHLCRVRNCVNPAHLEAVTCAENIRRAHDTPSCKRGHAWTPENTRIMQSGRRSCRACNRLRQTVAFRRQEAAS